MNLALLLAVAAAAEECPNPRFEREAAAAVERVAGLEPGAAAEELDAMRSGRGEAGPKGRPVTAALLKLRGDGVAAKRAVFCPGPDGGWVGVESEDGRFFRMALGPGGAVDLRRLREAQRPRSASRTASDRRPGSALWDAGGMSVFLGAVTALAGGDAAVLLGAEVLRDTLAPEPEPRWPLPEGGLEGFCAVARCPSRKARATIDTDGWIRDPELRALVSGAGFDRHHQSRTHMAYAGAEARGPERYLDATKVPYVVRHKDSPWKLGDIVVVEYGGNRVAAVVGDSGKRRRLNEISFAAAERLGIDPHGNRGGTDASDPVTVTALPGLSLERPADERELLGALRGVQRWLDRGPGGPVRTVKGRSGTGEGSQNAH